MLYCVLTAWVDAAWEAVLRFTVRHDECHARQMLDRDIIWRAYNNRPGKVRQGDVLEMLMALANRAPHFRFTPPEVAGLALAAQYQLSDGDN